MPSPFPLTSRQQKRATSSPDLSSKFAITEIKGDWKWLVELFALFGHYWKSGAICHRCCAARIPKYLDKMMYFCSSTTVISLGIRIECCGDWTSIMIRYGILFTHFDTVWVERNTQQFIDQCLPSIPAERNPLIHLEGFDVQMLTLGLLFSSALHHVWF